jgi:hypothetical protein
MRTTLALRSLAAAAALATAGAAAAQVKPREEPDGERVAGHWGVAFFGLNQFTFGAYTPPLGAAGPNVVSVYTVGVRRWMAQPAGKAFRNWGLDIGLGLALGGGSDTAPGVSVDAPSAFGIALHSGLPLAVAHSQHVTFELIPELDIVHARSQVTSVTAGGQITDYSGSVFQLGARAGLEVYFGFIGVPQLSLEATVGASVGYISLRSKPGGAAQSTASRWFIGTSRQNEPWNIFGGNVGAIYYF